MRKINGILTFILLILLAAIGVYWFGGTLSVGTAAITASAADYPDVFASIQNTLSSGAAPRVFSSGFPSSADGITLTDVTLTLKNPGLVPAEWVACTIEPLDGDIAIYSMRGEGGTVEPRGEYTLNFKFLSRESADAPRTVRLQYYLFGLKRTLNLSL